MWPRIKDILKLLGIGFLFFLFFLVATFPFQRLGPKISAQIEKGLNSSLGTRAACNLQGFSYKLPFGFQWDHLSCADSSGAEILSLEKSSLIILPSYQNFTSDVDGGHMTIKANAGLTSGPTRLQGDLNAIPMKMLSPLLARAIARMNPAVQGLKFDGRADGSFEIPLRDFSTKAGSLDLQFKGFKLPEQSTLKLIGLKELPFTKAVVKATLSSGKLNLSDIQLLSDHLSGKVEGSLDLNDEFSKSIPNITLKWNVRRSDALLSTPIGQLIANSPCPNQDTQGFCSKRVTRMEDFKAF